MPSSLTAIITAYIMIVNIMIIIIVINNNKIILIDITILRIYLPKSPLFVNFRVIFGYFRYKKPFFSPNTLFNGRSGGDKASFFRRMKLCLDRQQFQAGFAAVTIGWMDQYKHFSLV